MIIEQSRQAIVAGRYAQAFLNIFWDQLTARDHEAVIAARSFFKERKQACFLMKLALLNKVIKVKALHKIRIDLGLSDSFEKLFALLIDDKRSDLLYECFKALSKQIDRRTGTILFTVTSVGQVNEEQKKMITAYLEKAVHQKVQCRYKQDFELIAGIRLQSAQFLWEASVRDRLNKMRSCIKS